MTTPPRVLLSYAHSRDGLAHATLVRQFWEFLRTCGIDARLDIPAADQRQDWSLWMADEIRAADHILIIASAAYRERAEGRAEREVGRGVQWEARLIRDAFYADQNRLDHFLPVVLPGQTIEGLPDFLAPRTSTVYQIKEFSVAGADSLLRLLTGQPSTLVPPLGPIPVLAPHPTPPFDSAPAGADEPEPSAEPTTSQRSEKPRRAKRRPRVHNEIAGNVHGTVIQADSIDRVNIGGAPEPDYDDEDDY